MGRTACPATSFQVEAEMFVILPRFKWKAIAYIPPAADCRYNSTINENASLEEIVMYTEGTQQSRPILFQMHLAKFNSVRCPEQWIHHPENNGS